MKLKKIIMLIAIPVVAITPIPFVLASCNEITSESDYMLNLYKNNLNDKDNPQSSTIDNYKTKWINLGNSGDKDNKVLKIQYAIEYSLYSFVLEPGYQIITHVTWPEDTSIYKSINDQNSGVNVTFKTSYFNYSEDTNLISYTGLMKLDFSKNTNLKNEGNNLTLNKGDAIEFAYSFQSGELDFDHKDSGPWIQDIFTPNNQLGGNALGFVQIIHNGIQYSSLESLNQVLTNPEFPNYFNLTYQS